MYLTYTICSDYNELKTSKNVLFVAQFYGNANTFLLLVLLVMCALLQVIRAISIHNRIVGSILLPLLFLPLLLLLLFIIVIIVVVIIIILIIVVIVKLSFDIIVIVIVRLRYVATTLLLTNMLK